MKKILNRELDKFPLKRKRIWIRRSNQLQSSEEQLRLWRAGGDDENEAHQQSRPVSYGPNS